MNDFIQYDLPVLTFLVHFGAFLAAMGFWSAFETTNSPEKRIIYGLRSLLFFGFCILNRLFLMR